MKRKIVLFATALIAALTLAGCGQNVTTADDFGDFNATSLSGSESFTPSDFENNALTVIKFWATWCGPCVEELPVIQRVIEAYEGQGVKILGILVDAVDSNINPDTQAVDTAVSLLGVSPDFRVFAPDEALKQFSNSNARALPTTYIVDSNGEVVKRKVGGSSFEEWSDMLDELLAN